MNTSSIVKNWSEGTIPSVLEHIHQNEVNIAIYNRDVLFLENEIHKLLQQNIKLNTCGTIETILSEIQQTLAIDEFQNVMHDIENLLHLFKKLTNTKTLKLLLTTVNTNMCRKFHTDVNDVRLLCTYAGPGTLWLKEENINRIALGAHRDNSAIVIDQTQIQQVKTGAVCILKGAKYQQKTTNAAVHRSPTIEENSGKRLLLRIDTDEFLKTK